MLTDQSNLKIHDLILGHSKSEKTVQELVVIQGALSSFKKWPIVIGGTIEYSYHDSDYRYRAEIELSFNAGQFGVSRVVYTEGAFVVKLADSSYNQPDDNVLEYRDCEAMPQWLIPKVYGKFDFDSFGVKGSALVCQGMQQTVFSFLFGVMSSPPTKFSVVMMLKVLFECIWLMCRAARHPYGLILSDWHLKNLMLENIDYRSKIYLVDFAGTKVSAKVSKLSRKWSPYPGVKKAYESFRRSLVELELRIPSNNPWISIYQKIRIGISSWWPNGHFKDSLLPSANDICAARLWLYQCLSGDLPNGTDSLPAFHQFDFTISSFSSLLIPEITGDADLEEEPLVTVEAVLRLDDGECVCMPGDSECKDGNLLRIPADEQVDFEEVHSELLGSERVGSGDSVVCSDWVMVDQYSDGGFST